MKSRDMEWESQYAYYGTSWPNSDSPAKRSLADQMVIIQLNGN